LRKAFQIKHLVLQTLAPRPGLEPGTYGLTVGSKKQATNHRNK